MITIGTSASVAANGRLLAVPMFVVDDVADELRARAADEQRRDEVAERQREGEDRAGHDARAAPAAASPLRSVRQARAPRSPEASSSESGMRSSAPYTGTIMNGSQM